MREPSPPNMTQLMGSIILLHNLKLVGTKRGIRKIRSALNRWVKVHRIAARGRHT